MFVRWGLSLRHRREHRHTLEELHAIRQQHTTSDHWSRRFRTGLWTPYNNMQRLTVQRGALRDDASMDTLTRSQRDVLSGSGLTRRRRERPAQRAGRMLTAMEYELRLDDVIVAWLDNLKKQRYRRNPHEGRKL